MIHNFDSYLFSFSWNCTTTIHNPSILNQSPTRTTHKSTILTRHQLGFKMNQTKNNPSTIELSSYNPDLRVASTNHLPSQLLGGYRFNPGWFGCYMEGHISGGVCEPSKADLCSQILLGWGGKDAGDRYGIYIIIYIYINRLLMEGTKKGGGFLGNSKDSNSNLLNFCSGRVR